MSGSLAIFARDYRAEESILKLFLQLRRIVIHFPDIRFRKHLQKQHKVSRNLRASHAIDSRIDYPSSMNRESRFVNRMSGACSMSVHGKSFPITETREPIEDPRSISFR